jgi:hypothetical protein
MDLHLYDTERHDTTHHNNNDSKMIINISSHIKNYDM